MGELLPYLERLRADIEKDVARFRLKSEEALFLKPVEQWSAAERQRYLRGTTEQRLAESDKWMSRTVDAAAALHDLREIMFLYGLKHGRQHP